MPAKSKINKSALPADDFDDMLADFRAQDLQGSTSTTTSTSATSRTPATARMKAVTISDEDIIGACRQINVALLRRWGQQGVRVMSAEPFVLYAAFGDSLDVLRCLVKDLGADVNEAGKEGYTALTAASQQGKLATVMCLVTELGADVNKLDPKDTIPLSSAAFNGHVDIMRCLVKECGANVNQGSDDGITSLIIAAQRGNLSAVQCLVKELGADIHQADKKGGTPLMAASHYKHSSVVKWLIKAGADPQASAPWGTAADLSKEAGASAEQTAYLEAKTHCSSPECSGAGILKCTGCKNARYCGEPCQLAHWKAHKADCKRWSAKRTSN
jgi:hypothetical protein